MVEGELTRLAQRCAVLAGVSPLLAGAMRVRVAATALDLALIPADTAGVARWSRADRPAKGEKRLPARHGRDYLMWTPPADIDVETRADCAAYVLGYTRGDWSILRLTITDADGTVLDSCTLEDSGPIDQVAEFCGEMMAAQAAGARR